ncbi:MAG TPA: SprT family zinc-dependent metalloprotease [Gammaproteobacteria bacterium]|nr:SprT family zinc-dependent metalloprotease [Gammaproteobacteria bacterium]
MTEQLGLFESRGDFNAAELASAPLSVRESRRARHLTLRLLPPHTLELVVPSGTRAAEVSAFVHEHRQWIADARRELAQCRPLRSEGWPSRVELRAIGKSWSVSYRHDPQGPVRCRVSGSVLEVATREESRRGADGALRSWLLDEADYHLTPWLLRESQIVGRRPTNVQVRLQRTRWGSCSSGGTVSLNAALLFVEPPLVRYLFIHELCHMIALNHSRKFWSAVARYEPDYEALDRRLTTAWSEIPLWAHSRGR